MQHEREASVSDGPGPVPEPVAESWLIPRDHRLLMELPVAMRWEVTRRHPYYLRFWQLGHQHHCQPATDPTHRKLEESAALILQAIGVTGDPPPPSASVEALGATGLSQAWKSGAVAPLSFRGLVGMLLTGLPVDALAAVGQLLSATAAARDAGPAASYGAVSALYQLAHPALDAVPNRPVVGVNVQAPQRVILEALKELVRQWKQQEAIPEKRRRDDKLDQYLAVWDLREGWAGDGYDGSQEHTLRQIARQLGIPLSTAANRYRSAFRLIIGRDYSPPLWARVLGFLKLSEWVNPEALPKLAGRRPWRDRQPRLVLESVVQPPGQGKDAPSILNTVGVSPAETGLVDLVLDIQDLLAQGKTNEEIAAALELTGPEVTEVIDYYRQRHAEDL
jgi:hypothetical protein